MDMFNNNLQIERGESNDQMLAFFCLTGPFIFAGGAAFALGSHYFAIWAFAGLASGMMVFIRLTHKDRHLLKWQLMIARGLAPAFTVPILFQFGAGLWAFAAGCAVYFTGTRFFKFVKKNGGVK